MHPLLIGFDQKRPQSNVKLGQAEHGSGWRRAGWRVARLMTEEELVRGLKNALDLAASARLARDREDQRHVEFGRDLLHVVGREVAAMIAVEGIADTAHRPV